MSRPTLLTLDPVVYHSNNQSCQIKDFQAFHCLWAINVLLSHSESFLTQKQTFIWQLFSVNSKVPKACLWTPQTSILGIPEIAHQPGKVWPHLRVQSSNCKVSPVYFSFARYLLFTGIPNSPQIGIWTDISFSIGRGHKSLLFIQQSRMEWIILLWIPKVFLVLHTNY